MMIIQLIRDIETFAPTLEIGKIDRGKYTKWMIRMFPANEFVAEFNDFAKHPHTTTPITTQAAYISSGLPLSIMKRNQYTIASKAGSITVQEYPSEEFRYWPLTSLRTRF